MELPFEMVATTGNWGLNQPKRQIVETRINNE